jgi:chemotaxis protein methyltransferase CheR
MLDIGIVDTRAVIKIVQEKYGIDFTDYALISFKRRLERIILLHNIRGTEMLMHRLEEDPGFIHQFLMGVAVESTEMFRDPSFWRLLRDDILPALTRDYRTAKVWVPSCVSGDEVYSLAIVLKEIELLNRFEIHVSGISDQVQENLKSGAFKSGKIDLSEENYTRSNGLTRLSDHYTKVNEVIYRNPKLLEDVRFFKQNINFDDSPQGFHLILFRNQMIYYNQTLQHKVLKNLHGSLVAGGLLAIGIKENLSGIPGGQGFQVSCEAESVYKKIG